MAAGVIFLERARKLRVTESRTWPCRLLSCCPCLCLLLQPLMFLIDWFDQRILEKDELVRAAARIREQTQIRAAALSTTGICALSSRQPR